MYLGKVLTVLITSCMAQFDSICLKNNQVKEDQAQEEQTQRDQAQRDQALKDLPKYVEANLARKMTMNDQENRTQKPRCSSNYKLLLKLPWKNSCSYKGVRLWFCNNPCNLAVFEILPLQRDQIERDQRKGDQTKRVLPEASFLEEWHPDNLPDKLPDSYGIKIMPQVYL